MFVVFEQNSIACHIVRRMRRQRRFFCQLHPKQQRLQKHSGLNFWRRWKFNKSALFAFKNAQNEPIFLSMFINAFFWLMEAVFKSRKIAATAPTHIYYVFISVCIIILVYFSYSSSFEWCEALNNYDNGGFHLYLFPFDFPFNYIAT